jgi:hypothetical protein
MNANSNVSATLLKTHPLLKSKSYDTRLNEDDFESSSVFMARPVVNHDTTRSMNVERYSYYDDNLNSNVNLNYEDTSYDSATYKGKPKASTASNENNNESNDNDTKIIITSFAPKPDKSRPMSHQVANVATYRHPSSTNSLDNSVKSDNQENNP